TEVETQIISSLKTFSYTTDNKAIETDITKNSDELEELLATKILYFNNMTNGFFTKTFLELRIKAVFNSKEAPKKLRKIVVDDTPNIELFELLRTLRNELSQENDVANFQVFTQKALYEICETLPTTKSKLLKINGMGETRVEKYGSAIINVIKIYCEENNIETNQDADIFEEAKPKKQKSINNSKKISLEMFKSGKSIFEIAKERSFVQTTILNHLTAFIPTGEIKVTDLMSVENYNELKELIPKKTFENLSDLKNQLDDKFSYGELRLILEEINKENS
ncbi:MAG: helix-turn-helix domain-containing protein, partial [Lutibacter sp.]|nr:helix-turn-helix domain-containing protein [Lutibacter sp.]